MISFEPIVYAANTLSPVRLGLLLIASILISLPEKGAIFAPEIFTRLPFAIVGVLLVYIAATIVFIRGGKPQFSLWQTLPTAIALGSTVAFTFLAWIHIQEEADILLSLFAFAVFAPFLSLFFVVVLVVLPRFVGWK